MKPILSSILILTGLLIGCGGDSVNELYQKGLKAFEEGKYKEAREYYRKALAEAPADKELLFQMGLAFKRDYVYDSALFYFKRLDLIHPKDRATQEQLYEIAVATQDYENAVAAVGGLVATGDNIEDYYPELADLWDKREHPANAYYYYELAHKQDPDEPEYYKRLASLATTVKAGTDTALMWIDSAIAQFGADEQLTFNRANVLARLGRWEEAEKIFRRLANQYPNRPAYQLNLAGVLAQQESKAKKQEALAMYRELSPKLGPQYGLDSLITRLEEDIK